MPGRKRIRAPASDSSSDDENATKKTASQHSSSQSSSSSSATTTAGLSVGDKELRMRKMISKEPDYESTQIHEALVKHDWNVDRALKYMREYMPKKKQVTRNGSRGFPNR